MQDLGYADVPVSPGLCGANSLQLACLRWPRNASGLGLIASPPHEP
jgi:hypothetical protein